VLGDLMLDEYIFGKATRISQEAPVMVVRQDSTRAVPGGAANVAANIVALGAEVSLLGIVGDDAAGKTLDRSLTQVGRCELVVDATRPTTRKLRVVANHSHQVLRIDHEDDHSVSPETEAELIKLLPKLLEDVGVLLISDYQKGCITERLVEMAIAHARQARVPVVANAKPSSAKWYRGASLLSLNRYEAGDVLGIAGGVSDSEAEGCATRLRDSLQVERVVITLGGSGMVAAGASVYRVPAVQVAVYDEAGAGDTVIATLALALAAGKFGPDALELAATTAGIVVQKVGVAVPLPSDLEKL
jgi:D-beta-D-heptose 7-phosphate kinase/D-beta-D-heptose 1-phosphate adenosyltransferase